jgi:GTP cyclohydrolase I
MTIPDVTRATEALRELLLALGEDADREGLRGTPLRSARAWVELTEGYRQDAGEVLRTSEGKDGFSAPSYDQMIVVAGIPFWSTCEHHLIPFGGVVDVAYLPGAAGKVVGLSKIPRLVEVYARRLQIQEQLTAQIAGALEEHLQPIGVGVRVSARHLCASCRGVRKDVTMITSKLTGRFRDPEVRAEFWTLADSGVMR